MTMTRQHFKLIAEVIKDYTAFGEPVAESIARTFAERLHATNPNFNPSRFLKACGVESTEDRVNAKMSEAATALLNMRR